MQHRLQQMYHSGTHCPVRGWGCSVCFVMSWLAKRRLESSVPFPAPAWAYLGSWLWGKATYVISQLRKKGWFCSHSCLPSIGKSFTGFLQQKPCWCGELCPTVLLACSSTNWQERFQKAVCYREHLTIDIWFINFPELHLDHWQGN